MIAQSDRLTHVHSDIRGPLYVEALRMQAAGTPVLKLNTGNIVVTVEQLLDVELTMPVIEKEMTAGDTIPFSFMQYQSLSER